MVWTLLGAAEEKKRENQMFLQDLHSFAPLKLKLTTPRTESERRAKGFRFWERPPQGASRGRSASSRTHRERGEAQESSRRVCNDYRYKKNPTPAEEQTKKKPTRARNKQNHHKTKKTNRCGNHKGHSRSLTPPIKKPSRRGATSAPRDLHTILPHLPKMRRSALPTSAEKKRRARVELGKEAFQERSTVGDHRLRRLFCLGLRRLRLNHACPLETKTMSASGTPPLQLRPRHVVAGMPKQRSN